MSKSHARTRPSVASPVASPAKSEENDQSVEQRLQRWADLSARFIAISADGAQRRLDGDSFEVLDPLSVANIMMWAGRRLLANPVRLMQFQMDVARDQFHLLSNFVQGTGGENQPVSDRRLRGENWEKPGFDLLRRSYLVSTQRVQDLLSELKGAEPDLVMRVRFYSRLLLDAFSPANFPFTNPDVLRRIEESGGENLLDGFENLVTDLERGKGRLAIRMTDERAFTLGENIAATPGKVIAQNRMMQLIQYEPTTTKTYRTPLLIIPPWINKYYILDLSRKNSMIRWLVAKGFTVFVISWVNPDQSYRDVGFDEYLREGPIAALDIVEQVTGERGAHVLGYCIGGTLLATALAWLARRSEKDRVVTASFLTTLVDFADAGDLRAFIDPDQLAHLDEHMKEHGFLEGGRMSDVFNLLRDNDLIWPFVVNNYLMGNDPPAFDLLYWNSDTTRMPIRMHDFYLREMYLHNRLSQPDALTIAGESVNLGSIDWPVSIMAAREDHIAPWHAVYRATRLYKGETRFILAASGHVAGVVNPPEAKKYGYWLNPDLPEKSEDWLSMASWHKGSWWPAWATWLAERSLSRVDSRKPGKALEDAPGSYVRMHLSPDSDNIFQLHKQEQK